MRRIIGLLLLLGTALLIFFITREVYRPEPATDRVNSTVLLERVRPVLKLVTVEGEFSELYAYRHSDAAFDWLKQFPAFQKRAILRVKARASVGYDLEGMRIEFDDDAHTATLLAMEEPVLLSLEHDVDYYDLDAGTFNPFTREDHTRLNAEAKELTRSKVTSSGLFAAAEEQRNEMLRVIRAVVENAGWRFEDKVSSSEVRSRIEERSPDAPIPSPVHAP